MAIKRKRVLKIESNVKHRPRVLTQEVNVDDERIPGVDETPYEINPELTRRKAKELFMLHGWEKKKLLELGIPETTLDVWLYKPTRNSLCWKDEKELFHNSVMHKLKEFKADELKEVCGRGVNILKRSLMELDESGAVLTVAQMEKLTAMLTKLDPVIRLEEGKPTSIRQDLDLNQKQIQDLIEELDNLDPLLNYTAKGKIN